jgi:hypothetical protein
MVGPLAHIPKNRFYIGEIVYRGEVHKGEHEPILERTLFDGILGGHRSPKGLQGITTTLTDLGVKV